MKKEIAGWFYCANWIPLKMDCVKINSILGLHSPLTCSFEDGLSNVHVNSRNEYPYSVLISPKIGEWTLICGYQLSKVEISTWFTERLSLSTQNAFSFGVDIWCGYHAWMFAKEGRVVRYFEWRDGIENTGGQKLAFEKGIDDYSDDSHVFYLSKQIGFDIESIQIEHLAQPATLMTLPSVLNL
ncbi:MAG: hypothetical protein IT258_10295 [Saprospiraceae bacterium]|nr:hypothetical protein [Saprospiraceae bacterium]